MIGSGKFLQLRNRISSFLMKNSISNLRIIIRFKKMKFFNIFLTISYEESCFYMRKSIISPSVTENIFIRK